jgi:Xaa-Pro dipeptidase
LQPPQLVEPRATLVPSAEVEGRLARLQAGLSTRGLEAAVIMQNADLYYFSGTVQRSFLYVPAAGEPTLFVRKLFSRARLESPLAGVVEMAGSRDLPGLVAERYGALPRRMGLELDVLPVTEYRRLEKLFPQALFDDVGRDIVRLRAVKSPWEVERIRAAAAVAAGVCELIPGILREGLTEVAFAGLVEAEARRLGHEGIIRMRGFNQEMFYGHLLTGVSGAAASYLDTPLAGTGLSPAVAQGASFRAIRRGDHVVFDFAPVREGYIADLTRIFALGEMHSELRRAYDAAMRIQAAVVAAARPGVTCRALYDLAVRIAADEGLAASFMGHGAGKVRFIGHGVGLELDELPVLTASDVTLAEGMVIALEPKFVLPGLGAIGIENTWLMTSSGLARITDAPEHIRQVD